MGQSLIELQVRSGVAALTLNRPDRRNALTRELIGQLRDAVAKIAADPAARLLVLAGAGSAFCAGMDLDEMQRRASAPNAKQEWLRDASDYRNLLLAIFKLDVPTLAVVQGPAIAGGFGLVLACDLVLASTAALFSLPEPKRGISAAVVSPLLVHRLGAGPSMPLLLAGQTLSGADAHRLLFCHYLAEPDRVAEVRGQIEASILSGGPGALAATKKLVRGFNEATILEQLERGMLVAAAARETSEAREGLAAFLGKRPPAWDASKLTGL